MSTKIGISGFNDPTDLNTLPCAASARYLNSANETVDVLRICQDPNNISVGIIDFSLVGVYEFTPQVNILSVNGDTSYQTNGIQAPFVTGHSQNPTIPINTNCQVFNGQVAFDFSEVIPNYINATEIEFELVMNGSTPQSLGVSFPAQSPSGSFVWQKNVLPNPISLQYVDSNLIVVFDYQGDRDCACNIQCVRPSGVTENIQFCPDEKQELIIRQQFTRGDPQLVQLQLQDGIGNIANIDIQGLIEVKPQTPEITGKVDPRRIELTISESTQNGTALNNVDYQIIRYEGTPNNYKVWKDWSSRMWDTFYDTNVIEGQTYGYAVRFKGEYNDVSDYSDWAEVTV